MNNSQLKNGIAGLCTAAALVLSPVSASAQELPLDGLLALGDFGGGLEGLLVLGDFAELGDVGDMGSLGGMDQLEGLEELGNGFGEVGGLSAVEIPVLGSLDPEVAEDSGALPPLALGLITGGGFDVLSELGIEIIMDAIEDGGPGGIPLIGSDLEALSTQDGLATGLQEAANDFSLPIGLPVIERSPAQLYAPVLFALFATYGLELGDGSIPEPGLGEMLAQ